MLGWSRGALCCLVQSNSAAAIHCISMHRILVCLQSSGMNHFPCVLMLGRAFTWQSMHVLQRLTNVPVLTAVGEKVRDRAGHEQHVLAVGEPLSGQVLEPEGDDLHNSTIGVT